MITHFLFISMCNAFAWYGLVALARGNMTPLLFAFVFLVTFLLLRHVNENGVGRVPRG